MVCYASGPSAALQVGELATMDSSQAVVSCLCVERGASICNLVSLKGFHLPLFITLRCFTLTINDNGVSLYLASVLPLASVLYLASVFISHLASVW